MTTKQAFDCPWSGTTVHVNIPPKLTPDEFCPKCDFPMFWTHEVRHATEQYEKARVKTQKQRVSKERLDARKHRHPPADQPVTTVSVDYNRADLVRCRNCALLNPPRAAFCSRCGTKAKADPLDGSLLDRWRLLALAAIVLVVAITALLLL